MGDRDGDADFSKEQQHSATWPLDRHLVILWIQNAAVLVCTVVAILEVTQ